MQRAEYKTESPLQALMSLQVMLALAAMAGFYFTVATPDRAVLSGNAPEKAGQNTKEVLLEAQKMKPFTLMEHHEMSKAVQSARDLLAANPNDVATTYCAAVVYFAAGLKDESAMQMKRALALAPQNRELRLNYARQLAETGKMDESVTQYKLVISQAPKLTGPRMDLAQIYLAAGKPDDAAKELTDLLVVAPNDSSAHKALGIALARAGQAQEGLEEYMSGTLAENGSGQPQAVKFILGAFGDIDKAKYDLEQQALRRPDDPMPKLRLAEIYLYVGHPEDAKQYLIEARKLQPNNPEIHRSLAVAFKRLGDPKQALTCFMQSVALEQEQNSKLKKHSFVQ
ncbi:MAG: tetratricopeptide repeat protein [Candidatus Obscuribacterales bacterium]|nr:tetratricopeptide repeat protein [Candidatus Obscuribacterales bacterium]